VTVDVTMPIDRPEARSDASGARPRTGLPQARSVLAVVGRPGDEAYYLGAVLDAFRAGGTQVSALAFTGGTGGKAARREAISASAAAQPIEFEVASLVLRVTHRLMIDYPDGGLDQVSTEERVGQVLEMIQRCSADLLLTADAGAVDPLAVDAACDAGRAAGVPVLAWTLPAGVAAEVRAAGGLGVPDFPTDETDFEVRVVRKAQRRAMRAYRSRPWVENAQLVRLELQGDREWLHWLVLPDRRGHTQGR
jgi:LmbE family N-acetylglucosaminyl deacetylase